MNTHKLKLAFAVCAILFLFPHQSQAYFTTHQNAVRLSDTTALYTVTYEFGFPTRDFTMPIGAVNTEAVNQSPYVSYTFLVNDEPTTTLGTSAALVLTQDSDVEIRDNQYFVPAGKQASFTLVTLLTIPEAINEDISLLVTNLPFTMIQDNQSTAAHLNPSELQYYVTPTVSFGE